MSEKTYMGSRFGAASKGSKVTHPRAIASALVSFALLFSGSATGGGFFLVQSAMATGQTTTLTVTALDLNGNVHHMWTVIKQNGSTIKTGYTPMTFSGIVGETYSVKVSNYNNIIFLRWAEGSTTNPLTVTLGSSETTLLAYYQTSSTTTTPGTTSTVTTKAFGLDGSTLNMWTVIKQNGSTIKTGYTPMTFSGTVGQTYSITVDNYQNFVFDHWADGSISSVRSVTVGASATDLIAYYQTGSTTSTPPPPPSPSPQTAGSITASLSSTSVTVGSTATVSGMVYDTTSNPMANVNLIVSMGTSFTTAAVSDSSGFYSVSLPTTTAGTFAVNVKTASGTVSSPTLSLTLTSSTTPPPTTTPGKTGVYIPMYSISTLSSFLTIMKADGPSLPYIVSINPNSGPGSSVDSRFVNAIATLHSSGLNVTVIGYVPTGYGSTRTVANVEGMIDTWYSLYPNIDGIMFDEVSSSASTDSFYKTITDYARAHGAHFLRGNPGAAIDIGKVGMFDTIDVGESGSYPSASMLQSDTFNGAYSKAKFGFIVHDQATLNTTWLTTSEQYLGYVYITNAVEPNPYAAVPSYFAQEVATLQAN